MKKDDKKIFFRKTGYIIFKKYGFEKATMNEIAKEAGCHILFSKTVPNALIHNSYSI